MIVVNNRDTRSNPRILLYRVRMRILIALKVWMRMLMRRFHINHPRIQHDANIKYIGNIRSISIMNELSLLKSDAQPTSC